MNKYSKNLFKLLSLGLVIELYIVLFSSLCSADTLVISTGFEDWSGWNGSASPADGYIFTAPSADNWANHTEWSIVTTNCEGRTAYSGNFYYHTQMYSGAPDPCTGRPGGFSSLHGIVGFNGAYPTGPHDTTELCSIMTGDTGVLRFRFRTTGDWTSQAQDDAIDGSGVKFVRWAIGANRFGDSNNVLIKARVDTEREYPRMGIYDNGDSSVTYGSHTVDWDDGNWHSLVIKSVRTAPTTFVVSTYLDDWDMENAPFASRSTTVPAAGSGEYCMFAFNLNWSGPARPINSMGMDYDDIEVWEGLPSSNPDDPEATAPGITQDFRSDN